MLLSRYRVNPLITNDIVKDLRDYIKRHYTKKHLISPNVIANRTTYSVREVEEVLNYLVKERLLKKVPFARCQYCRALNQMEANHFTESRCTHCGEVFGTVSRQTRYQMTEDIDL